MTDAVLDQMNKFGRVGICGSISMYNKTEEDIGMYVTLCQLIQPCNTTVHTYTQVLVHGLKFFPGNSKCKALWCTTGFQGGQRRLLSWMVGSRR